MSLFDKKMCFRSSIGMAYTRVQYSVMATDAYILAKWIILHSLYFLWVTKCMVHFRIINDMFRLASMAWEGNVCILLSTMCGWVSCALYQLVKIIVMQIQFARGLGMVRRFKRCWCWFVFIFILLVMWAVLNSSSLVYHWIHISKGSHYRSQRSIW